MDQLLKQRETWLAGQAKLEAWHAQTREEALEPDLEIVDCHHHLWDYRQLMGYNLLGIFKQQYYLADELVNDIVGAGHNVTRTVYVEAHAFHGKDGPDPETTAKLAPLGEIFFAQGVAAQFASGIAVGVVGESGTQAVGRQAKLFAPVVLILIFTEALALYGLIVGMILAQSGQRRITE